MKEMRKINDKKFIKGFMFISGLIGLLTLSGCASSGAPPKCPDSTGLQCARVDQINRRIDGGVNVNLLSAKGQGSYSASSNNPRWQGARVMHVWLAPYTDDEGNYREASVVDAMISPGQWQGNSAGTTKKV